MLKKVLFIYFVSMGVGILCARAGQPALAASPEAASSPAERAVLAELAHRYPAARVSLVAPIQWTRGAEPVDAAIDSTMILGENARGELWFTLRTTNGAASEGRVPYAAWMESRAAARRVLPGEKLTAENFTVKRINLASGQGYEYRGAILPATTAIEELEARQTIVEGQFLTSAAVEKIPDVRRGDLVRIHLVSGNLNLTTAGSAQEPGFLNQNVRVMSTQTKRELVGKLVSGRIIEVRL